MKIASLIKAARLKKKFSQEKLAALVGVTKGAVSQWETGVGAPSRANARALAIALGINQAELEARLSSGLSLLDSSRDAREIPFLSWAQLRQLGDGRKRIKLAGGTVAVGDETPADAIAASVDDDSMAPEYGVGDVIIFSKSTLPRKGDQVVARIGEDHFLRTYAPRGKNSKGEEVYDLVSQSPEFPTIPSNGTGAELLGTVIEHRKRRRA